MTPTFGTDAAVLHRAVSEVMHYVWDSAGVLLHLAEWRE